MLGCPTFRAAGSRSIQFSCQRLEGRPLGTGQGLNAATTVYEVEAEPSVAVAVWGPGADARMSSRVDDALPFCTSTT